MTTAGTVAPIQRKPELLGQTVEAQLAPLHLGKITGPSAHRCERFGGTATATGLRPVSWHGCSAPVRRDWRVKAGVSRGSGRARATI